MEACHELGCTVYLITSIKTKDRAWPRESIADIFYMEDQKKQGTWNMDDLIRGTGFFLRKVKVDRLVALDDFDVEKASQLREEFRIPGMGATTGRYFRDKLAMRAKALEEGISVPGFSSLFNDENINEFVEKFPGPWVLKPRSEASATGIKKVQNRDELWQVINNLGDERQRYLVEQFKPGDVYHVDSLILDGKVIFSRVSRYLDTPMEVAHGGGIFRSHTVPFGEEEDKSLQELNKKVMAAFGMQFSASHTEFIRSRESGEYYFLETSSRVGGAHLAEMVEASSGINLWKEWARIEFAKAKNQKYKLPKVRKDHAGIIVSLSRYEHPEQSHFTEDEIVWRLNKAWHIGLIIKSKDRSRILELLDKYAVDVQKNYHASMPSG